MPDIKPAYWALIPASVRYDRGLPASAKLLYGEITALSNRKGYCHAQNAYFCDLFDLSDRSITRLLSDLAKGGYIRLDVIRSESNEVLERRIYLVYDTVSLPDPPDKNVGTPPDKNIGTPPDKNGGENNTSIEYIPPIVPKRGTAHPRRKKDGWTTNRSLTGNQSDSLSFSISTREGRTNRRPSGPGTSSGQVTA